MPSRSTAHGKPCCYCALLRESTRQAAKLLQWRLRHPELLKFVFSVGIAVFCGGAPQLDRFLLVFRDAVAVVKALCEPVLRRGLGRRMPAVCAAYTFAAVALTGVPPMCGFLSKWNLLTAAEQEGSWLGMLGMVALIISAVLTAVYILFPAFLMYFRPLEERPGDPEGKRWDKSPRAGLLLSVSCVMVLAAGLEGPRLEEIFRTVLGLR